MHSATSHFTRIPIRLLVMLIASTLLWASTASAYEMKMIRLQHRMPEEFVSTISQLLAGDGTVSALNGYLVVQANPEKLAQIESLIQQLDTRPQNIRISVQRSGLSQTEATDASVSGRVSQTTHRTARIEGNASIHQLRSTQQSTSEFSLTVLENHAGFISTGQTVAFSQQWLIYTRQYIQRQQRIDYHDIETGFSVRPRLIGNEIELEVRPAFRSLQHMGTVDFEVLSTLIRVPPGQWVDIGATMQQRDEVSRTILGFGDNQSENKHQFRIKADL